MAVKAPTSAETYTDTVDISCQTLLSSCMAVKTEFYWYVPKPAAGVIPTRPLMIPEQKPRILNFRSKK